MHINALSDAADSASSEQWNFCPHPGGSFIIPDPFQLCEALPPKTLSSDGMKDFAVTQGQLSLISL